MSKTSRESTPENFVIDGFKGLPDDRCQCRHWGVVIKGQVTFRYPRATR